MTVAVLGSKGPFADAVSLYSQHLARPPSASRPPPGGGGRGRRRPRSASAAVTPTTPPLSFPAEPLAADKLRNSQEKACPRPGRAGATTNRTRPASAAATGGARPCPAPPGPSRPRPVTATGTRIASETSSTHHGLGSATSHKPGTPLVKKSRRGRGGQQLRRRVVSAGGYPSSSQGDYWKNSNGAGVSTGVGSAKTVGFAAKGSAWEYGEESHGITTRNHVELSREKFASKGGSDFYYEHQDLGTDSEVMQKATEFVSKILNSGNTEEGQQSGAPPTPQCQLAHPAQAPQASMTGTGRPGSRTAKIDGSKSVETTKRSDGRPVRGRRRKRVEKASVVSTTATAYGGNTSTIAAARGGPAVLPPTKFAANTAEDDTDPHTLSRRQQQQQQRESHKPRATTHKSASTCEFPFPPGRTGQDLRDGSPARGENKEMRQPRNVCKDGIARCPASDGHTEKTAEKETIHCLMTPLAFDVFCSMRPTFVVKDTRSKQERPDPTIAPGGTGLPKGGRGGDAKMRHQPHRDLTNGKRGLTASPAIPVGDSKDRTVACTWTSIFGAVCAGAERGRARAEVLKAARRETLRQKRRKRCAAAQRLQLTGDTPAFGEAAATSAVGTTNGRAVYTSKQENASRDTSNSSETGVENSIADGGNMSETVSPEGDGDVVQPLLSPAPSGQGSEIVQQSETEDAGPGPGNNASHSGGTEGISDSGYHERVSDNKTANQPMHRSPAVAAETSPLFRHPSGGGPTRIGVNAPRSLQLCPGNRGFSGAATKTSRHCFSSPRWRGSREERRAPPQRSSRQSPRRPATASGADCSSVVPFGVEADGGSLTGQEDSAGGKARGGRPETAWSFFSKGASKGRSGERRPIGSEKSACRDSQNCGWTDGDSLRRRVDSIADAIAKDLRSRDGTQLHDGTRFQGGTRGFREKEKEEIEMNKKEAVGAKERHQGHTAASLVSQQAGTNSSTEQPHQKVALLELTCVGSEPCLHPTSASEFNRDGDELGAGMVNGVGATDHTTTGVPAGRARISTCAAADNDVEQPDIQKRNHPDDVGVVDTSGLRSMDGACLTGDIIAPQSVQVDASLTAGEARNGESVEVGESKMPDGAASPAPASTATFGSPNDITACDGNSIARKSRRRSRVRPTSAPGKVSGNGPTSSSCFSGVRRSISSPGLVQGSDHPGQSLADIVDIAEAWEYPDRRDSRVLSEEAGIQAVEDAVGLADCDAAAPDATAASKASRVVRDDGANDTTFSVLGGIGVGEGQESGNGCKSTSKLGAEHHRSGVLGQRSPANAGSEDSVSPHSRSRFVRGDSKPDTAAVAESTKVETPLEFRKATIKLKYLVAEASVAVDGHEKAWRNSKERAEQMFNDLRFAAEEDAERSADGAAMETRLRLQRIVIESGLENSRRVEKEAALEETRRVLRQDTGMYEARASASEAMLQTMRTLEGENDSCDRSVLLECRRNKSLIMLRDRTERERDELRAACRRRREEAAAMDDALAEARHARGLLLGHTQHTVERMACLAEYVSVMRRWLGDKLTSRRHARVTSKTINLEFERKSKELDAILKKEAPAPTRSNGVDGRSSAAGPTQSKDHIKNVVAPVNLDLSMSLESFRDASSRLRGLLLSLGTHVSSAQESVEIAPAGEQGEKS